MYGAAPSIDALAAGGRIARPLVACLASARSGARRPLAVRGAVLDVAISETEAPISERRFAIEIRRVVESSQKPVLVSAYPSMALNQRPLGYANISVVVTSLLSVALSFACQSWSQVTGADTSSHFCECCESGSFC